MNKIISEIQEGKWYVSMECLFAGFDYAVTNEDGTSKILARDDETAFLTKHLRSYGGTGEYQGHKIGRSLRQISFSGKGLVAKPANPRSVILNASKAQQIVLQDLKQGDVDMSNENLLEQQIADLKVELASAKEALEASHAKESAEAITSLESEVSAQAEAIKTLEESVVAKEATIAELQAAAETAEADMKEKMEELRKMQKEKKMEARKAALLDLGLEAEEAEESLASYEEFDDATFETVLAAMTKMKKVTMQKKKEEEEAKVKEDKPKAEEKTEESEAEEVEAEEATAEEATEELFDGVESTEATLVDASDENDEIEATRASVAEWLENNVLSK